MEHIKQEDDLELQAIAETHGKGIQTLEEISRGFKMRQLLHEEYVGYGEPLVLVFTSNHYDTIARLRNRDVAAGGAAGVPPTFFAAAAADFFATVDGAAAAAAAAVVLFSPPAATTSYVEDFRE